MLLLPPRRHTAPASLQSNTVSPNRAASAGSKSPLPFTASRAVERFSAQVAGQRGGGHAPPKPQLAGTCIAAAVPSGATTDVAAAAAAAAATVTARRMVIVQRGSAGHGSGSLRPASLTH